MEAFWRLFGDDADFVVIDGTLLKGRHEIQMYHAKLQKAGYKDSHLDWNPVKVRFLRQDVAVAHVATEITYGEGENRRTSFATVVLTRQGRNWLIAALQNMLTSGPPVGTSQSLARLVAVPAVQDRLATDSRPSGSGELVRIERVA